MESIDYQGWTITTRSVSRCFGATMIDPSGKIFHQSTVCWYSHHSARRYAEKFIQWYTEIQNRVQDQ